MLTAASITRKSGSLTDPGYVYVLSNPSMPGLVKIGRTARNPEVRAADLSGVTGIPTPFVHEFSLYVDEHAAVETEIHAALDAHRIQGREFFRMTVGQAITNVIAVYFYGYSIIIANDEYAVDFSFPPDIQDLETRIGLETVRRLKHEAGLEHYPSSYLFASAVREMSAAQMVACAENWILKRKERALRKRVENLEVAWPLNTRVIALEEKPHEGV